MIKIMKDRWSKNNGKLREALAERTDLNECGYKDLVKLTFQYIFNSTSDELCSDALDVEHITEIDDGDYQGTLIYMIPFDTYQPSAGEYLMTFVSYGSCSGCDTLQAIQDYGEGKLTESQLNDFMSLCKDLVCETIRPYNFGWRENGAFDIVEEEHNPLAHPETYVDDAIAMINDMTDAQRAEVIKHLSSLGKEES